MTDDGWIPDDTWAEIVRHVPIVSVDLVVIVDGGVVLGKRTNEPAKGEWFVPGGRIRKGERLTEAVHRVAEAELGIDVKVVESLGVYEHLYEMSDVPDGDGKHYLANGFVVRPHSTEVEPDTQHETVRVFQSPPDDIHPHVEQYLRDADMFNRE